MARRLEEKAELERLREQATELEKLRQENSALKRKLGEEEPPLPEEEPKMDENPLAWGLGTDDTRPVCKPFVTKGKCDWGDKCRFRHPVQTLGSCPELGP